MLKNRKILRRFTAQVVRTMTYLSLPIMILMCIFSILPIGYMHTAPFIIVSGSSLVIFAILSLIFRFFSEAATKASMGIGYIMFVSLFAFALLLSFASDSPQPYATVIGFFIVMPIIITDKRWRVNLFNIIMCITALVLSFMFKDSKFFFADCMNCTIFMLVGNLIGNYTLINQLNYIDLREGKLDRDLEVLKAKSEAKTTFLTNMSHEIRTPINSVLGFNEMILRECKDDTIAGYARNIDVSGRTLLALINDILDFSRIEAGKLDIVEAEYELDSMISDLVSIILPRAEEKRLTFTVNVNPSIPNILVGDERRIKQCVLNLLTNAVKYTHKGSVTMNVGFNRDDEDTISLKVSVIDTGIGIKPENIDKMFEAFERIEEKRNRDIEGTGLGMKIVQQLLGKMGTYLDVQSEYGAGSRFSFSVEQGVAGESVIGNFDERYKRSLTKQENYQETFTAPNAKLLVVDDVEINLTVVRSLLKRTQVKIDTAMSGRQAIEMVRQKKYDVIFLDHRMPELDGVETFQMMKSMRDNRNADTPVIALTANAIAGAREMFLKVGFKDYITKPIDVGLLEKMLIKYLPPRLVSITQETKDKPATSDKEMDKEEKHFLDAYRTIDGVDTDAALVSSGGWQTLQTIVQNYYMSIDDAASAIEHYAEAKDVKNYTVLVHALKSSSRLVGALELSEKARHLEECGDKEDMAEIAAKTGELLSLYRSYKVRLKCVVKQKATRDAPKKEMTAEKAEDALSSLGECAQAFDFESAERILDMIDEYEIPDDLLDVFAKTAKAVHNADTKAVMDAINSRAES